MIEALLTFIKLKWSADVSVPAEPVLQELFMREIKIGMILSLTGENYRNLFLEGAPALRPHRPPKTYEVLQKIIGKNRRKGYGQNRDVLLKIKDSAGSIYNLWGSPDTKLQVKEA